MKYNKSLIDMKVLVRWIGAGAMVLALSAGAGERKLLWADEFNGPALDTNIWRRIDRGSSDWNRHMSTRADLLEMREGCVVLVGKVNTQTNDDPRPFLTGGITNRDTDRARHFRYGKVEMRVKFEDQKGAWPALWMCSLDRDRLGRGYPWNGEIDIVERLNGDPFVYHTVHSGWTLNMKHPNEPPHGGKGAIRPGEFNVYGFERTKDALIWSVNGKETFRYTRTKGAHPDQWPFDNSHFFYLDMQLGGKWVGSVDMSTLPVRMWIDWLRVYE